MMWNMWSVWWPGVVWTFSGMGGPPVRGNVIYHEYHAKSQIPQRFVCTYMRGDHGASRGKRFACTMWELSWVLLNDDAGDLCSLCHSTGSPRPVRAPCCGTPASRRCDPSSRSWSTWPTSKCRRRILRKHILHERRRELTRSAGQSSSAAAHASNRGLRMHPPQHTSSLGIVRCPSCPLG